MQISDLELSVTLEIAYLILVSLDNGAKMSPKRKTFLSLVFACICLSKSLRMVNLVIHLNARYMYLTQTKKSAFLCNRNNRVLFVMKTLRAFGMS